MMNELQRQTYLSALGLDTYMPRWHLPFAPVSVACQLPDIIDEPTRFNTIASDSPASLAPRQSSNTAATPINSLISDFLETKKVAKIESPLKKSTDLAANSVPRQTIAAFSLSVWRPIEGLMIVDSRNSQLALPTDTLLKNLFQSLFQQATPNFKEEVLRSPMIENSFTRRTADDARAELQTWLAVQSEIKPINYLWLMGENAIKYLVADAENSQANLWCSAAVADSNLQALLLPSLNELLLNPLLKKSLHSAIRQYNA